MSQPVSPRSHPEMTPPTGTVTFLFTDIEGSTQLLQQLGPRYADLLAEHHAVLRTAIATHGGYEVGTQGDAFMVAFHRASDAIGAAVVAQRMLHDDRRWTNDENNVGNDFVLRPSSIVVKVRMGLHTGEPTFADGQYVGIDVHRAARICSAGHGGQVLVSQSTVDLVEHNLPDGLRLRDMGVHRLRDIARSQRLFQLLIEDLPADFPPLKTFDAYPTNLQTPPTPLVGREAESATLANLLRQPDVRLVTLLGPGGVGKTRLSLHVGIEVLQNFTEGVFFVNLAAITDPSLVPAAIAQTMGVRELGNRSMLDTLKEALRERQTLLILDNLEQVVQAAPQIADLLTACPKLKVLATSRSPLRVRGERVFPLAPLALPPRPGDEGRRTKDGATLSASLVSNLQSSISQYAAVELFIQRAVAVKPDFQITNATAPAVAEICYRLDGLPLAIELAAARIRLLSPQAMLHRLDQRLKLLTSGPRDLPERHQTLRAAIEWSYDLLSEDQRRLFARLAVFAGGWTLEAAETVVGNEIEVLDGIGALVDENLIRQVDDERGDVRFNMLETIREYALERMLASGEADTLHQAHTAYYLRLAEEAEHALKDTRQSETLARLVVEQDNLRAVHSRAPRQNPGAETGLRLASALRLYWTHRGYYEEGRQWLEATLSRVRDDTSSPLLVRALTTAGALAGHQGDLASARAWHEAAIQTARTIGDQRGLAYAQTLLADIAMPQGQPAEAHALHLSSATLMREVGDDWGLALVHTNLGDVEFRRGNLTEGRAVLEQSETVLRQLGDHWTRGMALSNLAFVALAQDDTATAQAHLENAVAISRTSGNKWRLGYGLIGLGEVARAQGDLDRATDYYTESLSLYRDLGHKGNVIVSLINLGYVTQQRGNLDEASALFLESLRLAQAQGNRRMQVECLAALAGVIYSQGDDQRAARLLGAVETVRAESGALASPVDRPKYERQLTDLRTQLGASAFEGLWNEGRALSLDQATDYVLELQT